MDHSDRTAINVLTETIAREKANLHARIERLRHEHFADTDHRPGRLYEVFQALND